MTTSTNTTSTFLNVSQNLSRLQTATAAESAVKTASAYFSSNIGNVKTASDLVGNYRLLSYALDAYGLGSYVNSKALVTQVLQGGVSNPHSLANTLSNPAWKAFASAFSYLSNGSTSKISSSTISTTKSDYVEQTLESDQGSKDPGVQLALYFQRIAPTITSAYQILADPNLLHVVQTIFGISPDASASNIDQQAKEISNVLPMSELQDPHKVLQLTERFTAQYDSTYGPTSTSGQTLTFKGGNSTATETAATSVLSSVISSNGSAISSALSKSLDSPTPLFSNSLLNSIQSFRLGG